MWVHEIKTYLFTIETSSRSSFNKNAISENRSRYIFPTSLVRDDETWLLYDRQLTMLSRQIRHYRLGSRIPNDFWLGVGWANYHILPYMASRSTHIRKPLGTHYCYYLIIKQTQTYNQFTKFEVMSEKITVCFVFSRVFPRFPLLIYWHKETYAALLRQILLT